MSCCPPAPEVRVGDSPEAENGIADVPMLAGESTECYMATANNPTGKHDDATGNVENKIENATMPMKADGTIDVTFRLQDVPASPTKRTPTRWEIRDDADNAPDWLHPAANSEPSKPPGWNNNDPVRVDNDNYSSGPTLRLHGTFRIKDYKQKYRCTVKAFDAAGEIDNRGYVFSPDSSTPSNNIQLISPMPGGRVDSRFDPQRFHPIHKIIKPHNGCDFNVPGKNGVDVVAAADGVVSFVGYQEKGAGNYIKIKHNNGSGQHLCTTVYMHLATVLVKEGQQVSAGQKVAVEGNTGGSTGPHLHFECRLPNNVAIDPEPLFKGSTQVARQTDANNKGVEGTFETRSDNAVLTPANVTAKTGGCEPFGPTYPTPTAPDANSPAPAVTTGDPFELAWALTMQTEVVGWTTTPPTIQTTLDGVINGASTAETKILRQRVGFVDHPADPGGATKFGIAQNFNKGKNVEEVKYVDARNAGFTKYWQGQLPAELASSSKPRSAIAAFNIGFLCGPGGVRSIFRNANVAGKSDMESIDSICDAMKAYLLNKIVEKPGKAAFKDGWMRRAETVRQYAKSVTLT